MSSLYPLRPSALVVSTVNMVTNSFWLNKLAGSRRPQACGVMMVSRNTSPNLRPRPLRLLAQT